MELTTQVIKDVTLMNIHAGTHELLKALQKEVKHIGNHISERMGHLLDQKTHTGLSEDETAELERLDHLIVACSGAMDSITAAAQVNDIGYKLIEVTAPESPDERETVKAVVTESSSYKEMMEIIERRLRDNERTQVDELIEMLSKDLLNDN